MSAEIIFFGPGAQAPSDVARIITQLDFLKELMLDGVWRTLPQICEAFCDRTGRVMLETSASANLRTLRRPSCGGYVVDRRQKAPGLYEYRVTYQTF